MMIQLWTCGNDWHVKRVMPDIDKINKTPDYVGAFGKAWLCDIDACYKKIKKERTEGGEVAIFIIEASWAHPFWHSYVIFLIHLRGIIDGQPAAIHLPGATHEFMLFALNPDKPREPIISEGEPVAYLTPANFGAQFIAENDAAALNRMEQTVQLICDGNLSPDTDFRGAWIKLFGDNMMKK